VATWHLAVPTLQTQAGLLRRRGPDELRAARRAELHESPAVTEATIRLARPDEAEAVRAVARDAYERWTPRLGRESSPMHWDYAEVIAQRRAWVLEVERRIIGFIDLREDPDVLGIANIAVVSAEQGKGYGTRLIAFAEEEAKRRGYRELRLYVNALMTENIAMYEHVGFSEVERFRRGEGDDRMYLRMTKQLGLTPRR
jgi:ribosomal protein S18 acetylase RimI-like enzyme